MPSTESGFVTRRKKISVCKQIDGHFSAWKFYRLGTVKGLKYNVYLVFTQTRGGGGESNGIYTLQGFYF